MLEVDVWIRDDSQDFAEHSVEIVSLLEEHRSSIAREKRRTDAKNGCIHTHTQTHTHTSSTHHLAGPSGWLAKSV